MKNRNGTKKKVMLITPMLHQGGFERICVLTARLLQESYDVVVVVFSMEDIAFDVSGIEVIDLNLKSRKGKIGKIINLFRRGIRLSILQKRLNTDISYSFGMTANIANSLSFGAKKKITACHSFEEIKDKHYMRLISRCSDQVLCCAKKMADMVQETYGFTNVTPLWNPCDIEQILAQSNLEPDQDIAFFEGQDRVLVSMGREDDVKGFWHLMKVFRRVNEKNRNTRLAIVGDGDCGDYQKMVRDLDLEGKVLFTGLKKNPFPYLKRSDIYVLTSLSEGLPNALVEALALSLPIVSANCLSGPAEILHKNFKEVESKPGVIRGDFGILTPVLSPKKNCSVSWEEGVENPEIKLEKAEEQMAEEILSLLEDKELYESYRKNSFQRAKDFSIEKYLEGLVSCMEGL